jgi:hypothetical protein
LTDAAVRSTRQRIVIRASSTPDGLDCRRRWAGRAIPDLLREAGYPVRELPQHCGAPIGTGVHAAAAHLLRGKRDQGTPPPFAEAEEVGHVEMDKAFADAGAITWDGTAKNRPQASEQMRRMARAYAEQVVPKVEPVLIEQRLEGDWPGAPGFVVSGQMDDLIRVDAGNGLRDTKTGREPRKSMPQVGCYSMLGKAHGYPVADIAIDFIERVQLITPQPAVVQVPLDLDVCERLATRAIGDLIAATTKFLRTQDIESFPTNPGSTLCSDRFCPLWGTKTCRDHYPQRS